MISNRTWLILFAISLCCSSFLLFIIHYEIFYDFHHILIYTIHDLAFLPIEVLLVTLILHQMLERRAMKNKLNKLNMVIGVFFSEIGTPLLRFFSTHDPDRAKKIVYFSLLRTWDDTLYQKKIKELKLIPCSVHVTCSDLILVKKILTEKEDLLVRMLENPVLLEHELFTEVLQAVFHLTEELKHRGECSDLPDSDLNHVSGDMTRSYTLMIPIWLSYLKYLKNNYPYLHSLAVRTNPFTETEDVIVRE
ncbi:hypothetical protein KHC33_10150 [Methanospirillum sp. J.3.6.1-F.2.7.3]|uniref:Uncharacterized protein n=1 Tax=Methanospirillum purgamenti TaxID=2834276 RepID=A0A8E7EIS1_9EURY|nr:MULTISPECIES: hypothetical protein [Methanospirillum]MDX8551185.1 hypothetical protein [Methanospirillum hungatei]QVV87720.1 hypothetical protein KHC33_10150 [Methanospirillum sp. J.3.6.1-F.2.7.3]